MNADHPLHDTVQRTNALSPEEMRAWLRDVLDGKAFVSASRGDVSQAQLLSELHPLLSHEAQRDIDNALVGCVQKLSRENAWTDEATERMLHAVEYIGARDAGHVLQSIVESERFGEMHEGRQRLLLQTLVALGVRMHPDFWRSQASRDPEAFASLAFSGLAQSSPQAAVDLLPTLPHDGAVADRIGYALPHFIDQLDPSELRDVRRRLADLLPDLKPSLRREIEELFEEEGEPLTPSADAEELVPPQELSLRVHTLGHDTFGMLYGEHSLAV